MIKKFRLKIVYVHDLQILYQGKKIFGQYGFGDKYLEKFDFLDVEEINLITRSLKLPKSNLNGVTKIRNKKIKSLFDLKNIAYRDYLRFNNLKKIVKCIQEANLIVINMPSITGTFVFMLSRLVTFKNNIILDFASDGSGWKTKNFGSIISPFMTIFMRYAVSKSIGIIFVAEYLKNKFYHKNKKYIVCSNVNIELVRDPRCILKPLINKDIINISTISSISKRKGVATIVKGLNRAAIMTGCQINLMIIGSEIDITKEELLQEGKNIHIHFAGLLDKKDIDSILESSDLYIQASVSEGLPRATIEAMSFGLPVLATDLPCFLELKINKKLMFSKSSDMDLASSFIKLISSSQLYNSSSKGNIRTANNYRFDLLESKRKEFIHQIYSEINR
jgi:glycosyltransferase involved in cell wall biosynthesis